MIVSFTPIRSGSTGFPHKNIRLLNGKPLFHHVVLQALKVSSLSEVWISTDSDHYAALAPPGVKVHRRSKESASNTSPPDDVIMEFLKLRQDIATVVYLQATSPTTTSRDIEEALQLSAFGKGCISVQPSYVHLFEDNKPLFTKKTRRQDSKTFAIDGGIYVFHVADYLETKSIPTMPCQTMVIQHPVCDIDTEEDFLRASAMVAMNDIAFIDVDESHIRLRSNYKTEEWSTKAVCSSDNQLKSLILDQIRQIYESEIYINTGGNIIEEEGHFLVLEASEKIPFLNGTTFPKFLDGKSIKMQFDGDHAIMELVCKNRLQNKNVLIVVFGTEITTGLYMYGNVVKNAEVLLLLDQDFPTSFEPSDAYDCTRVLTKIQKALSLDNVFVGGSIHKHKHFIKILEEYGIKSVDSYFYISGALVIPSVDKKDRNEIIY